MTIRKPTILPLYVQLDIDPEILPSVMELNDIGLYTKESCAGHVQFITDEKGKEIYNPGFGYLVMTDIPSSDNAATIRKILEDHGFHNIKINTRSRKFPTVSFGSGGTPHYVDYRDKNSWRKKRK